jgi:hypothetical protein
LGRFLESIISVIFAGEQKDLNQKLRNQFARSRLAFRLGEILSSVSFGQKNQKTKDWDDPTKETKRAKKQK